MEVRCHCGEVHRVSTPQFVDQLQDIGQLERCIELAQGRLKQKQDQPRRKIWMLSARGAQVLAYFAEDQYLGAIEYMAKAAQKYATEGTPRKLEVEPTLVGADEIEEYLGMPRTL